MSFLKIIRPFNCLFVAITVFFGASYHNNSITFSPVIFAILSAGLIAAAGYVINDFFDLKIDLVNKPSRILPSGRMNPKTAYLFSIALFLIGIFVSLFTRNRFCIAIAFINSLILFYYAKSLKSKLFVGNIVVSYAAASTFIFGGFSSGNFKNSLIIAVFAFLYTLIREMIKDAEDLEGDKLSGANTLAIILGQKNTVIISFIPLILLSFSIVFFYKISIIEFRIFLLLILLGMIPLFLSLYFLKNDLKKKNFAKISAFMKIDMLILLLIFWLGK